MLTEIKDHQSLIPTDSVHGPSAIRPTIMRVRWQWIRLLKYIRTASPLHAYHEANPEDLIRPEDLRFLAADLVQSQDDHSVTPDYLKGGDISIRFWKDLRVEVLRELKVRGEVTQACISGFAKDVDAGVALYDWVTVEWPLTLLLARRA